MLRGTHTVVCSTGTVGTVHWSRPEVGVDITQEEFDRRLRKFCEAGRDLIISLCMQLRAEGKYEEAEKWWRDLYAGEAPPPPWQNE